MTTDGLGPELDVVVLGGGGHVGLPLSLVLADSGARVGIFDLDGAKLDRLGAGEMPFMETGAIDGPRNSSTARDDARRGRAMDPRRSAGGPPGRLAGWR